MIFQSDSSRNTDDRMKNGTLRVWTVWILVFASLAALFWPNTPGLIFMALAFFGVIHQSILIYDQIHRDKIENMSGYEYERYCAALLKKNNWQTEVTQASHDQGADIIATKAGLRLVIQCKKYARPIGNHAVQQIVAAVAHHKSQRGVVVGTRPFTQPAKTLAASNNVLLLHHDDLPAIDRLLRRSRKI
jgi:restriction system protein